MTWLPTLTKELSTKQQYDHLAAGLAAVVDGKKVSPVEVGEYATWPRTNDAIVRFQYRSLDEPTIDVGGVPTTNMIDVYCPMADWTDQLIVDPETGEIKGSGHYGQPVGWISYQAVEQSVTPEPKKNKAPTDPRTHVVLEGESVWSLARRFKLPAEELIEHNDLDAPFGIEPGSHIHLPYPKPKADNPVIKYELLTKPRQMHIKKEGGTKKWSFGNAVKVDDIRPVGSTYAEHANVEVLAIAHVPVKDNEGNDKVLAYMLDGLALGQYAETGRVQYTIGFNHTHLADGVYIRARSKLVVAPDIVTPKINTATPMDLKIATAEAMAVDLTPKPVSYKTTFKPLNERRIARTFLASEDMTVHDYDGRRPDRPLYKHQGVKIFGTFEKDGIVYGRPLGSVDNGYWFGIPMDKLMDEDELYNLDMDLASKVSVHGDLTMQERGVVTLSKLLSQGMKIAAVFKNKN